jgi:hypothetical protein
MINLSTESVDFCVDNSKVNKNNKKGEKWKHLLKYTFWALSVKRLN